MQKIAGGGSIGLSNLPKWLVGNYGRSIQMGNSKPFTSLLSIQLRRLRWSHDGRIIGASLSITAFATTAIDNGLYYDDIINGKQSIDQVQAHYNDPITSPMFWIYKQIEPWLINLGK